MQYTFAHFNFNVLDLDRSLAFYKEALGLEPVRTKEAEDGSFRLVYLGDSAKTPFELELTRSPMIWGTKSSTWPLPWTIWKLRGKSMDKWAVSVLKTPPWASISSRTQMATGSRSCPPTGEVRL